MAPRTRSILVMSRETTRHALRRCAIAALITLPLWAWAGCSGDTKIVYVEVPAEGGASDAGASDGGAHDAALDEGADAGGTQPQDAGADGELPPGFCGNASGPESPYCQYTYIYACSCGASGSGSGFVAVCPPNTGRPLAIDGCQFDAPDAAGDRWCCPASCIREPDQDTPSCGGGKFYSCAAFSDGGVAATLPSPACEAGPAQVGGTKWCCP